MSNFVKSHSAVFKIKNVRGQRQRKRHRKMGSYKHVYTNTSFVQRLNKSLISVSRKTCVCRTESQPCHVSQTGCNNAIFSPLPEVDWHDTFRPSIGLVGSPLPMLRIRLFKVLAWLSPATELVSLEEVMELQLKIRAHSCKVKYM